MKSQKSLAILAVLLLASASWGQDSEVQVHVINGFVADVLDADTIQIMDDETKEKTTIRLVDIDAPESTQPYGLDARNALRQKLLERPLRVEYSDRDKFDRILGRVAIVEEGKEARNLNQELVAEGWAWRYDKYSKDETLGKLQSDAKAKNLGLWAGANPISPWDWRNGVRPEGKTAAAPDDATAVYVTKTGKKYHLDGCRHLGKSKTAITLKNARSAYDPCEHCSPPK